MASIAGFRPWTRWTLTGLFRRTPTAVSLAVQESGSTDDTPRARRSYAPARDAFLENSAMRREMYRL